MMAQTPRCAECGAPMPAEVAAAAACPACLVRLALAAGESDAGPAPGAATEALPDRIGPYTLLGDLGEGGMGRVLLAEQQEPFRRRIALKVLKRGMDSAAVLRRFEAERQALALMSHPAIARVYDAGETPSGQPYFAMEYVDGVSITDYCEGRGLGTRERLDLFARVCDGLQHAHQKGVIHRDIKPSNVLVAEEDGRPAPKIIDFGIAKALGGRLTERTLVTDLGVLVGTPEYMSPEQTDPTALDIDTRSDVYSLGVLLYRLLTGALPFEARDRTLPGLEGLRRRIREETPTRPSVRQASLRRALAGDLDWIVMKALEKEPGRRYASAAELAADVRRHLAHEPILARPPSTLYQARRFARRNRALVGGIAATFVVLVAGVVVATVLALREARQRREAEQARDDLAQVVGFQGRMLVHLNQKEAGENLFARLRDKAAEAARRRGAAEGEIASVRASLDRLLEGVNPTDLARSLLETNILVPAAEEIASQYGDRPLVQAQLLVNLGISYAYLADFETAEKHMAPAVETIARLRGRDHADTLRAFERLARLYLAGGKQREAIDLYRETAAGQRRVLGADHPNTLESLSNLGWVLDMGGQYEESEATLRDVVERRRRVLGGEAYDTLVSMNRLSTVLMHRGRYDEAERWQRDTVEGMRRVRGEDDPQTLHAMIGLSGTYQGLGRFEEAERYQRQGLEGLRRAYGEDHPETIGATNDLGWLYQAMGRFDDARRMSAEALERARRVLGADHPRTIEIRVDLAVALDGLGRFAESEPIHREALATARRALGDDDATTLYALHCLGASYLAQRRYEEAGPPLLAALEARRRTLGEDSEEALATTNKVAELHLSRGRLKEAETLLAGLVELRNRAHGAASPGAIEARTSLATLRARQGRRDDAGALFGAVVPDARRVLGDRHPVTRDALIRYAAWLLTPGPPAARSGEQALEMAVLANADRGFDDPPALDTLALAHARAGDGAAAIATQKRAIGALRPDETALAAEYRARLAGYEGGAS